VAVRIQAALKCGFLRQIAEQAKAQTLTLREALTAAQSGHFVQTFQRGRLVVSTSGSGQSGSFEIGMPGNQWSQSNVFGLVEELLQMVELADPTLYPDDADPAHTDALRALIAENVMMGNVPTGVTSIGGDFTLLYIPVFGTGVST